MIGANEFVVAGGERTDERDCTGEEERILTGDNVDMGALEEGDDATLCGVGIGAAMGIGGEGGSFSCFNEPADIDRERRDRKEHETNSGRIVSSTVLF